MALQQYNIYDGLTSARVVSTTNQTGTYFNGLTNNGVGATFTYATGVLTIDGVTINVGDSVLLAGQTAAFQNGIYICTVQGLVGVAAVLQRRNDFQNVEQMRTGQFISISAGTAGAGAMYVLVEPRPAAIGNPLVANANNINFDSSDLSGGGLFLSTANNLSELANPTAQAASLTNLGFHSAKATGAGGSATVTITDARITAASVVVASIQSSANAVSIQKVTPGAGTLVILLSADPGANVLSYHSTSAVQ
jgi:hypothetical protein